MEFCETWMGTTDPEGRLRIEDGGEPLSWGTAMGSRKFSIYFGTTTRALRDEIFRWLTTRGRPGGKQRNRPVLQHRDGTHFTMKDAEKELGFWAVEVGTFKTREDAGAVEDYLIGRGRTDGCLPRQMYNSGDNAVTPRRRVRVHAEARRVHRAVELLLGVAVLEVGVHVRVPGTSSGAYKYTVVL